MRRTLMLLALVGAATAPAVRASAADDVVVIKAGRVVTAAGEEIVRGEIVIIDGKIELVGTRLEYPASARVIDAGDETVMPGMILVGGRAGLPGYTRSGIHGDLSVTREVYLSEMDFELLLSAGFTAVSLAPAGTGLPGRAAVYRTAGPDDERLLDGEGYYRLTMSNPGRDKGVFREAIKKAKAEIEKVEKARQEWEEKQKAEAEAKKREGTPPPSPKPPEEKKGAPEDPPSPAPKPEGEKADAKPAAFVPPEIDPPHRPIVDLIQQKEGVRLLIELGGASTLLHLKDVLSGHDKPLAHDLELGGLGSSDYHHVLSELRGFEGFIVAPALVDTLSDTAVRQNVVGELVSGGARVVLTPRFESLWELRGVRARAAELVRYGLDASAAVRGLTANAAAMLRLDSRLGTIEKGKDADLVFLSGPVLDPTSRVTRVMILGEVVWEAKR